MSETPEKSRVSRLFMGMGVIFTLCLVLSNLIAGKVVCVLGFTMDAATILFPVTYIFGDIFTEVYGFRNSRLVIWLGFACNLIAVGVYMMTLALPYPEFWTGQEAYRTVFMVTPRIFGASLVGYLVGEFLNSAVLSKIKVATEGRHLWFRTIFSTVIGEGADSVLFVIIAFAGVVPSSALVTMIVSQYIWKVLTEILLTPVTYAAIAKIKSVERLDIYDRGISYSPFG